MCRFSLLVEILEPTKVPTMMIRTRRTPPMASLAVVLRPRFSGVSSGVCGVAFGVLTEGFFVAGTLLGGVVAEAVFVVAGFSAFFAAGVASFGAGAAGACVFATVSGFESGFLRLIFIAGAAGASVSSVGSGVAGASSGVGSSSEGGVGVTW